MFRHVVHCDWSIRAAGRWAAEAHRGPDGGWRASGPTNVPDPAALVARLGALAGDGPTLAAFDFPIGFPAAFGIATGYGGFSAALDAVGRGEWPEIFAVATAPSEIGPRRPFYPARPGGTRLAHLLAGHGVASVADLVRACERAGPDSGAAGCMFWTMGASQVGKAALHGWREVIAPARRRGAALWPFDGDLAPLAAAGGLILAESYPGDGYGQIGFRIRRKGDPALRAALAFPITAWAEHRCIAFDESLTAAVGAGFPPGDGTDDGFDAVVGLLAALAVVAGHREAAPPLTEAMRRWEGWILGKRPSASPASAPA